MTRVVMIDRDELRSGWGGESRQESWGWRNESGSWFQRRHDAYLNERSVIFKEKIVGGRERVRYFPVFIDVFIFACQFICVSDCLCVLTASFRIRCLLVKLYRVYVGKFDTLSPFRTITGRFIK